MAVRDCRNRGSLTIYTSRAEGAIWRPGNRRLNLLRFLRSEDHLLERCRYLLRDLQWRTKDPVQTVKFTSGAIQESPELIMNSFHGGIPENSDVAPERALAYAISDDGSIIAWTWKSQLFIGPIGNFNKIKAIPIS